MKKIIHFFLLFLLLCSAFPSLAARQFVILKADDFRNRTNSPSNTVTDSYLKFIQIIERKNLKAGLGVVGKDLERPTPEYIALIKKLHNSDKFEIWNHGYAHDFGHTDASGNFTAEFQNQSYNYQLSQLKKSQGIVKQKLGITMRSFGAPGNRIDAITAKVLRDQGDIKTWMYNGATTALGDILGLSERTNIEWKTADGRTPNVELFKKKYNPDKKYLLLQLHPQSYSDKALNELEKTIDFLLSKDVEFILPYDYYQRVNNISVQKNDTLMQSDIPEDCTP